MGHPIHDYSRYNGLSLDELRRMLDEALQPRGHFADAWEEHEQYVAYREAAAMTRIREAHNTAQVRAVLRDLDEERPL